MYSLYYIFFLSLTALVGSSAEKGVIGKPSDGVVGFEADECDPVRAPFDVLKFLTRSLYEVLLLVLPQLLLQRLELVFV